jgi:predicted RNA polymerase sigma factor
MMSFFRSPMRRAARGHLLARSGAKADAYEALTVAIGLTTDDAHAAMMA